MKRVHSGSEDDPTHSGEFEVANSFNILIRLLFITFFLFPLIYHWQKSDDTSNDDNEIVTYYRVRLRVIHKRQQHFVWKILNVIHFDLIFHSTDNIKIVT